MPCRHKDYNEGGCYIGFDECFLDCEGYEDASKTYCCICDRQVNEDKMSKIRGEWYCQSCLAKIGKEEIDKC